MHHPGAEAQAVTETVPPGPRPTPTPAATTTSNSAPNIKLSSGTLFLAEMVRRHRAMQETSPETPVRTTCKPTSG